LKKNHTGPTSKLKINPKKPKIKMVVCICVVGVGGPLPKQNKIKNLPLKIFFEKKKIILDPLQN
jgi:hypothetical protein